MPLSFVYRWEDTVTGEYYVGVHRGTPDDGYVGSGVRFLSKYNKRPGRFYREILAEYDSYEDALAHEANIITVDIIESDNLCLNMKPGGIGGGAKWDACRWEKFYNSSREKNSESNKKTWGSKSDEEMKAFGKKISEAIKGKKKPKGFGAKVSSFQKGREKSEIEKKRLGNASRGTVFINKNGKNTKIKKNLLPEYLADGWTKGMIIHKEKRNGIANK